MSDFCKKFKMFLPPPVNNCVPGFYVQKSLIHVKSAFFHLLEMIDFFDDVVYMTRKQP